MAKKNSAILIESPRDSPNNNPGIAIIAAPGGRKLQPIELFDKSFGLGLSKKFGEGTWPLTHWRDDFTCPPMSSPTTTPS